MCGGPKGLPAPIQVTVVSDARDSKTLDARLIDCVPPRCKFFRCEAIAFVGFFDRKQTTVDRRHNLGLATDYPSRAVGGRQRLERQQLAKRADDGRWAARLVFDHYESLGWSPQALAART